MTTDRPARDALYAQAAADFGRALERLARAYEPDPDRRRDLLQEIHVAVWRSFEHFQRRCSLKTWVFRVAHNTATSVVIRRNVRAPALVSLDDVDATIQHDGERALDEQAALTRLWTLIRRLNAQDRQVMLLYLEGLEAGEIGEITGLSPGNVATKVHRIKHVLASQFHEGARRGD